ncbi:TAXI family TRAP transporter solute-binding subunit [Brevibacterium sp. CBA3109]|uniref:TAXI family TRAP transporter solute-binding subunit n=1 Tax=Brevibacterium koreense TaxID=3140787 RepID=A0AAU7UNG6_9MICO
MTVAFQKGVIRTFIVVPQLIRGLCTGGVVVWFLVRRRERLHFFLESCGRARPDSVLCCIYYLNDNNLGSYILQYVSAERSCLQFCGFVRATENDTVIHADVEGRTMKFRALLASLLALTLALSACTPPTKTVNGIRDPLVFATYGTGTSTYADLAAVTDAVSTDTEARLRIITSDTAIGRLAPMKAGIAQMGRLGDEYIFGFEGQNEFASENWGPQDLRVVWAPLSPHSLLTRKSDQIKTPADLKGRKIPNVTANPSVNGKIEAYLAYAGLTLDDVELVDVAYSEQPAALESGQIDALYQQVYGSSLFELESKFDVSWIELDPKDKAGIERVHELAPQLNILPFEDAPGQEDGTSTHGFVYTLPISTYADASEDEVYKLVSSMASTFPKFESSTLNTPRWNPDDVETMPRVIPFHPGTIAWLKENGQWTDEAQKRNDELIERGEQLRTEWNKFMDTKPKKDDIPEKWSAWKGSADL